METPDSGRLCLLVELELANTGPVGSESME